MFLSSTCNIYLNLSSTCNNQICHNLNSNSKAFTKESYEKKRICIIIFFCKQEEFDDEDDWIPSKAAGVCLMLLAQCCENAVVQPILEFVNAHFESTNWKERDAAIMAFGKTFLRDGLTVENIP
jgi:hypothetical protein